MRSPTILDYISRRPNLRSLRFPKIRFLSFTAMTKVRARLLHGSSKSLGSRPLSYMSAPIRVAQLITKFREEAAGVGFAVVLMTPDDLGRSIDETDLNPRTRQNVDFELGFFIGALRPEHVAALVSGDIELLSDYDGVVYISMDKDDWRTKLAKELQAAGYGVD